MKNKLSAFSIITFVASILLTNQAIADSAVETTSITTSYEQTFNYKSISLKQAQAIASVAEQHAKKIGVPMVISIVDPHGNLVLHQRMDGALLVSIDVSLKKAYSAVAVKIPTEKLAAITQPQTELYGIQHSDNKLITFGGGLPIYLNNEIIGGIGVSGGSVAEDISVAKAGLVIIGAN